MKLPSFILPVVLLFVLFAKPVQAFTFDPFFDLTLSGKSTDSNSDVTLIVTQESGEEFLDKVTFNVPADWKIAPGADFSDGAVIGSGTASFVFAGRSENIDFTVTNIVDTQNHLARWYLVPPAQYCCLTINVDGTERDGYSFTIDPLMPIETPINFSMTLSGLVEGEPLFSNAPKEGKYVWDAGFIATEAGEIIKSKEIDVPSTKTPAGTDVNVAFSSGAEITFASVSVDGLTTLVTQAQAPVEGTGQFQVAENGPYYSFSTTATIACPCTVSLPYDAGTNTKPGVVHLNTKADPAVWDDVTTKVDEASSVVTGITEDF